MFALIVAGEAIFALPFHVARFFRPTVLEVFNLTPTELGAAQGVYGIVAMVSYFFGGPIADRFPARKLMAGSLWSTAAGGLYMASFPGFAGASLMFGFFGITTILLFWAALIRATREWGGTAEQGQAYGLLDGGRGLLAAGLLSIGALVFTLAFPDGYAAASLAERENALRQVIYGYTLFTALTGIYIWFALHDGSRADAPAESPTFVRGKAMLRNIGVVLKRPTVWLQALVVICAYVGYKGIDNYTLFAVEVYGVDEVQAAQILTLAAWVRPFAALGAGLLGDRFDVSRVIVWCFIILLLSNVFFAASTPVQGALLILIANIVLACIAIYGLRGLYFAVFEETRLPPAMTGTAVGIVSVIGYTPDIFVTLVAGLLIDNNPGTTGHFYFFWFLAAFAFVGIIASLALRALARRDHSQTNEKPEPSIQNV